jgi:hypothetical protein
VAARPLQLAIEDMAGIIAGGRDYFQAGDAWNVPPVLFTIRTQLTFRANVDCAGL